MRGWYFSPNFWTNETIQKGEKIWWPHQLFPVKFNFLRDPFSNTCWFSVPWHLERKLCTYYPVPRSLKISLHENVIAGKLSQLLSDMLVLLIDILLGRAYIPCFMWEQTYFYWSTPSCGGVPGLGVGHDIYCILSEILTSNVRLFMQIINLYFTILHILHNNIYSEKNEHSGSASLLSVGSPVSHFSLKQASGLSRR